MEKEDKPEQFPVGMHVLAVDDSPTCLKTLKELLIQCKYHVTTANDGKIALEMLREERNKFDLVICSVDMPDMDGFRLLEFVGLEMDLPVITYSDYDHVMKAMTHDACDYLVKPVHLEELSVIWRHVVRKNTRPFNPIKADANRASCPDISEVNKKRNDHHGDDDNDDDDDDDHNEKDQNKNFENCSFHKKTRMVWSEELHQKFVDAINELGLENAVPMKIVNLMNVKGLTRQNVASHLQKYRTYLRKVGAYVFGTKGPSHSRSDHLDGLRYLHSSTLLSHPHVAMLMTGNSSTTDLLTNFQGIASSNFIQSGYYQNMSNYTNLFGRYQSTVSSGFQNSILSELTSPSIKPSQLLRSKSPVYVKDFNHVVDGTTFTIGSSFPDSQATIGSCSNEIWHGSSLLACHSFNQGQATSINNLEGNVLEDLTSTTSSTSVVNQTALSDNLIHLMNHSKVQNNHVLNNSFNNSVPMNNMVVSPVNYSAIFNIHQANVDNALMVESQMKPEQTQSETGFVHDHDDILDGMINEMMNEAG